MLLYIADVKPAPAVSHRALTSAEAVLPFNWLIFSIIAINLFDEICFSIYY